MDEILIKNWNELVGPEDTIYHLGDFAWRDIRKYVERLNGNIHLIRGSHDKQVGDMNKYFVAVRDLEKIVIEGQVVVLCHYAMRVWQASHFNSFQLFGHSHSRLEPIGKQWDVGVDNNNFKPLSWKDIVRIMSKRPDNPNLVRKGGEK